MNTEDEDDKEPQNARKAAKEFLRMFVLLDWTLENITTALTHSIIEGWEARIGGTFEDSEGQQHTLQPQQIAIIQQGMRQGAGSITIFELPDILVEIRREQGLGDVRRCLYCGALLDNQPRGRTRQYCDNKGKCKQAHHRQMQRQARRADILEQQGELRDVWQENHIDGDLLALLQDILIQRGEEEARAATDAILAYVRDEQARRQPEHPSRRTRKR